MTKPRCQLGSYMHNLLYSINFDDSFPIMLKIDRPIQCSDEIKEEIRGHFTSFLKQIEQSGCKDDFQIGIEARYKSMSDR